MRRNLELLHDQNTQALSLMNTTVRFKAGDNQQSIEIRKLRLVEDAGHIKLDGTVVWNGKVIALDGNIDRKGQDNELDAFKVIISNIPLDLGSPAEVAPIIDGNRVNPAHFELKGNASLSLSGKTAHAEEPDTIGAELAVNGIDMQLGRVEDVRGSAVLRLEHSVGSQKIEVLPSRVQLGGLQAQFNGAFGPDFQAENAASDPSYRFEILTTSATSMPAESNDPQLSFGVRIAGSFFSKQQRIQFSNLDVQTENGELYGQEVLALAAVRPK